MPYGLVLLSINVNYILQFSDCVDLSNVADVSEVHATSFFMVEVCKVLHLLCIYIYIYSI
jgi:hypothetical protein